MNTQIKNLKKEVEALMELESNLINLKSQLSINKNFNEALNLSNLIYELSTIKYSIVEIIEELEVKNEIKRNL